MLNLVIEKLLIPVLARPSQGDCQELKASLDYTVVAGYFEPG